MPGSILLQGTFPYPDLYSRALSAAYRWFYRIIDPDWALEQDADTWRKIWRDPQLAQAMQIRLHMVAGREWQVLPGKKNPGEEDKFAAELVADALSHIKKFGEARALMAQAVFHGTSYAFLEGRRVKTTLNGKRGDWWVPTRLKNINKGRFIYVPKTAKDKNGRDRVLVETHMYPIHDPVPTKISSEFNERLCRVIYMDEESRLGYGRGLLETVYFMWWAKQEIMKEGLKGLERWAGGMVTAKTDLYTQPGAEGRDSDSVRNDFANALEAMRSRHVMVVDKTDEIQAIDGGGTGSSMVIDFLNYIDTRITGVVLGSVLPYGVNEGTGSLARSETEQDVTSILIAYDQDNVSEAITDTVVKHFWKKNKPQIKACGLAKAKIPKFKVMIERREDYERNASIISSVISSGIPLKKQEVYEKIGFTEPDDDDETITNEQEVGGGFGGFGGFQQKEEPHAPPPILNP